MKKHLTYNAFSGEMKLRNERRRALITNDARIAICETGLFGEWPHCSNFRITITNKKPTVAELGGRAMVKIERNASLYWHPGCVASYKVGNYGTANFCWERFHYITGSARPPVAIYIIRGWI